MSGAVIISGRMVDDLRQRMLDWATRARAKPTFDLEEREHRLAVGRSLKAILDAASRDEPIRERVASLYDYMRPRHPQVVLPKHIALLARWASEDEQGLGRALRAFGESAPSPEERVARFVETVEALGSPELDEAFAVVLGSLFNFGLAPGRIPTVRTAVFQGLEGLLADAPPPGSPATQYAHHLGFARRFGEALAAGGLPVRDMIDVEALILICWEDRDFWVDGAAVRRARSRPPDHYLAACAIYRDEADHLAEWLEFHRLVGFERFYLYNNFSADHHREVLEPYIEEGLVALHDWPQFPGQFTAYDHCIATHGEEARWIGFFDIDEFLFSPTHRPVPEVLTAYEQWPGVAVNLPRYGTSGHRRKPSGLVIENYTVRLQVPADRTVKSVVDPAAVERCLNAHMFRYLRGSPVDENGYPVHSTATKSASFELLRANHYYSKSEEELREKHARRTADYAWERRPLPDTAELARHEAEHGVRDETILHYVEPLRAALARRAVRR